MILTFPSLDRFSNEIIHGVTHKRFGDMNSETAIFDKSLKKLEKATGMRHPIWAIQCHKDAVRCFRKRPQKTPRCDALVTQEAEIPLMLKIADCQGILLFDPIKKVIAAIHSGWRGSTRNIAGKALQIMHEKYDCDPRSLIACVSPSLGPCCAEFTDPHRELPASAAPFIAGRFVDFWAMSRSQLEKAGLQPKNISIAGECTRCDPDWFSHRRGDTGRMAAFIMLTLPSHPSERNPARRKPG